MEAGPALRILKMSTSEWPHLLVGTFGAALNGAFPFVFAYLLGEILGVSFNLNASRVCRLSLNLRVHLHTQQINVPFYQAVADLGVRHIN